MPRTSPASLNTAYSLALLQEYTHTLDSLPSDLSRNFADLRELDAVLSSSMSSITHNVQLLTARIEENKISKEERLFLLTQIAEEASRLKLGGEDKIRVACIASDNLKSHAVHLRTLSELVPRFNSTMLNRRTVYPHVATRSYMPASMTDGRRKRGGVGSLLSGPNDSPTKRRRVAGARDDDLDPTSRTPRKEKVVDPVARPRNNGRRRPERAASPTESILSVTSHVPPPIPQNQGPSRGAASNGQARPTNGVQSNNKRSRNTNVNNRHSTPQDTPQLEHTSGSHPPRAREYNVPPSSSNHPSLPLPYNNIPNDADHYGAGRMGSVGHGHRMEDWSPAHLPATLLEGPGMPVARSQSVMSHPNINAVAGMNLSASLNGHVQTPPPSSRRNVAYEGSPGEGDGADAEGGDGDGETDDKRYCICNGVSYGDMIGCDDTSCDKQWFHLACVGLSKAPDGSWHCDDCKSKRSARRVNRGGKRRNNLGR
ncbi:hypothetical protein ONZ45_g7148 [Pleurotus djamor]|nr:hypothetical protein ONZ45_g7148 [Pleurotus djamor]